MATSNSTNYNCTRDEIISEALSDIGVLGEGETASANAITFCSGKLNKMIKAWEAKGIHLWTTTEGTLYLREGVNTYTLITSTGDKGSASISVETTLDGDASGSTITVTDSTGMAISDNIGIELDDGTRQWTTITNIASNVITLNTSLTGAASDLNTVFTYTTQIEKPLAILDSPRLRNRSGIDRPMFKVGRNEYMQMPNKTTAATPTMIYPDIQRDSAVIYVWPTPNDVSERIKLTYVRPIQDFDASGDNPDLPQEWLDAVTKNLGVAIAPAYGISLAKKNPEYLQAAQEALIDLQLWDSENSSIYIVPDNC